MTYKLTLNDVWTAANALVDIARTPANAAGFVTSDEVRGYLARTTKQRIEGSAVTIALLAMFDQRSDKRFIIPE